MNISSDKPIAHLCARLCDVAPDGSSRRISYQVLNLTHRNSHSVPESLVPHQFYQVSIKLNDYGYQVQPGHRLRVALSTAYWPMIWPAPYPTTLTLQTEGSCLLLPVRRPKPEDAHITFEPPINGVPAPIMKILDGKYERFVAFDLVSGNATYTVNGEGGIFGEDVRRFTEIGTALQHNLRRILTIHQNDPLSALYVMTQSYTMDREGWKVRIECEVQMSATEFAWNMDGSLHVYENDIECAARSFHETIPRQNGIKTNKL